MARVRIDFPGPALFVHEIPVRISDLNYVNHLGHDALVSLLHEVRARFFRAFGKAEADTDGCAMVIVDLAVRYHAEAFFGQRLQVEVAACQVGSRSCDLVYRVTDSDSGGLVALAKTGIVFIDRARGGIVLLPAGFRRILEDARS